MNFDETAQVLAAIQIYDARHVDETTIAAWHKMISRFTLADTLAAVEDFFSSETDYLKPAHIIHRVKRIRHRRIELAENPVLNTGDEYDADGKRLPDADQKQRHLVNLIANGQLTASQYERYRDDKISLSELGQQAKQITR